MPNDDKFDIGSILQEKKIYEKLHSSLEDLHRFQDKWSDYTKKKISLLHKLIVCIDINYVLKMYRILKGYMGTARRFRAKSYKQHLEDAIKAVTELIQRGSDQQGNIIENRMLDALKSYNLYLEKLHQNISRQREIINLMLKDINKGYLIELQNLISEEFHLIGIEKEFQETLEKIDSALERFTEENKKLRLFIYSLHSIPPKERGLEYLKFLRKCTPEEITKLISLRKSIKNTRKKILESIIEAISAAITKFKDFRGLILYGSFSRAMEIPGDIDAFPMTENGFTPQMDEFLNNYIKDLTGISFEINQVYVSDIPCPYIVKTWKDETAFEQAKFSIGKCISDLNLAWWNFIGDGKIKEIIKARTEQIRNP